jgi:hypothetical protein
MTLRSILALAALPSALLAIAAPAQASRTQESIVQDDRVLLNYGVGEQRVALNDLDAMGVDAVHAVINWNTLAPKPNAAVPPKGVNLTDPASYNAQRWAVIDSLVQNANLLGIDVILSPAGPGPVWADGKCTSAEKRRARTKGICRTNPKRYGQFVTAIAKRYSGLYVDPATPGGLPLPKVKRWSLWNEPNLSSWLYPSAIRSRGKFVPLSAKTYRALVYAGGNALRANGHRSDQILLGETGPLGQGTTRTAPVTFYQGLFCVDAKGKRLKGRTAKLIGCPKRLKRFPVTGIAHHPYTKGARQPLTAKQRPTDITIANIRALRRVLSMGAHVGAISSGTASHIYFTEFGVSSSPPAKPRSYGLPLSKQAEYINQFEYMSWLNPAVRSVAQFQLEDDKFASGSGAGKLTFQTGLRYAATSAQLRAGLLGTAKPSRAAYRVPLYVVDRGRTLLIWGGVRGQKSGKVKVLNGRKVVKTVSLRSGYFSTALKKRKGTWSLRFGDLKSRVAKPVKLK